ncbi:MAG: L-serine ammonia-lyase, iron-sulfur-dependent, subunit alpha [Provencibacterium sp.]|jgi:L-serine dehydratase|nr:L-serine ammonia-lyase, iron-sulfur-dependent, subunit alpha [Provencibacterium sp.]
MLRYESIEELCETAEKSGRPLCELTLEQQALQIERPVEEIYEGMRCSLQVMREAVADGIDPDLRSTSGLTGGTAWQMQQRVEHGETLCGRMFGGALARALAVSELNAAMGRIVAAPTAGSCGIIPAAVLSLQEERGLPERAAVLSLFTASAVGMVIAKNASISGAQGGCQAECGSASAMAAAALVELSGGTPRMIGHAVAIALKNVLGLVCDPVAGLVEIPCIKRNAGGVANALMAAELALAGIESAIPPDEVILVMKRIGDLMPVSLRETADGGLAQTPTGCALRKKVFGE